MARKDRSLAGFDDVAGDKENNNVNVNDDDNVHKDARELPNDNPDFLDTLLEPGQKKKPDLILTGIYLQPDLARILDGLGKKGGRGAKSRVVNEALRKVFTEKGLL